MTLTAAATLLQTAMLLLTTVISTPTLPTSFREHAIDVANQAISAAQTALQNTPSTPTAIPTINQPVQSPTPTAPASTPSPQTTITTSPPPSATSSAPTTNKLTFTKLTCVQIPGDISSASASSRINWNCAITVSYTKTISGYQQKGIDGVPITITTTAPGHFVNVQTTEPDKLIQYSHPVDSYSGVIAEYTTSDWTWPVFVASTPDGLSVSGSN
jgi:hypothetical protein